MARNGRSPVEARLRTESLLLFCTASLALAVTPGPTMLLALSNGIVSGARVAAWGIVGATLASGLLIGLVSLGLGALLVASEALFDLLRAIGVVYLCWVGFKLWRATPLAVDRGALAPGDGITGAREALFRSATVALSNPKAILFFAAFLPQFVEPDKPQAAQYLVLGLVFVAIDALVMFAYAGAGTRAVALLSARGLTLINRGCAVAMFLLAAALAAFRRAAG